MKMTVIALTALAVLVLTVVGAGVYQRQQDQQADANAEAWLQESNDRADRTLNAVGVKVEDGEVTKR